MKRKAILKITVITIIIAIQVMIACTPQQPCPPCNHQKDWLRFYNMVNSKDSGCMILETGIVTFKPYQK